MKQIKDVEAMKGKVIENVVSVDVGESLVIIFTDETYAHIDVRMYGESHDIDLSNELEMHHKHEAGIVTDDAYNDYKERNHAIAAAREEDRDRSQLSRLKLKYEQ